MKVRLNKNFYSKDAIDESVKAFAHLCEMKIIDDYFTIELTAKEEEEKITREFCNYCLSMVKQSGI